MQWNKQQNEALKRVNSWLSEYYASGKDKRLQIFKLFGYAGTGKTTLAKHFAEGIENVCFAAFTGKAAQVMRSKGCKGARTLHSLVYIAERDEKTGEFYYHLNYASSPLNECKLLIIDECSMVDKELGMDVLSFGCPILVLGDPAQLPPPKGSGFFTESVPDFMLTEIHRQALDSPILSIATQVRHGERPELGKYGETLITNKLSLSEAIEADQILTGRNVTRTSINRKIREKLGYEGDEPLKGEKLICLKNDKEKKIFNGQTFIVNENLKPKYKSSFVHLSLMNDDSEFPILVKVHKSFFDDDVAVPDWKFLKDSQEMDYSYAITTHKSQGSQWKKILICDESICFGNDWKKWLYTAITRASESMTLVLR